MARISLQPLLRVLLTIILQLIASNKQSSTLSLVYSTGEVQWGYSIIQKPIYITYVLCTYCIMHLTLDTLLINCVHLIYSGFCVGSQTVVINGYRHNGTLASGDSVPLGTQIILFCRFVGHPYGTLLSYTWTCPSGPCEVEGYYGRKVCNEHILAVNTTSTSDGGTYTCQVTATGGQEATGNFSLRVTGMYYVLYNRLIDVSY